MKIIQPRRWKRKAFLAVFTLLWLPPSLAALGSESEIWFNRGNGLFREGKLPEAAEALENSSKLFPSSGALLNLGIVEWHRGRAGAAILAWERALWIKPFDPQARNNLAFARTVAQIQAPDLKWHERVSMWLPPNTWVWVTGGGLWLAAGAIALPGFFRWRRSGWQQWAAALGTAIFLFGMTGNLGVLSRTSTGFVIRKNASLRLTPSLHGEMTGALSPGDPLRRISKQGDFWLVRSAVGDGWIQDGDAGWICRE